MLGEVAAGALGGDGQTPGLHEGPRIDEVVAALARGASSSVAARRAISSFRSAGSSSGTREGVQTALGGRVIRWTSHSFVPAVGARTHKMGVYEMTDHPIARQMLGEVRGSGGSGGWIVDRRGARWEHPSERGLQVIVESLERLRSRTTKCLGDEPDVRLQVHADLPRGNRHELFTWNDRKEVVCGATVDGCIDARLFLFKDLLGRKGPVRLIEECRHFPNQRLHRSASIACRRHDANQLGFDACFHRSIIIRSR